MGASDIILDPKIRDWVLIPLTIIMVFMGLGRHFAAKLMKKERRAEPEKVKDAMTLNRAKQLGMNCYFLPESAFATRMAYFNDSETGILRTRESEPVDPMKANPMMSDPNMMMDMMGNNMIMIVPNLVMMPTVSYFFAGFLTAKLPFSLTPRFKLMLQRGVEVTSLDVSYVSSLSWYFMLWMGLRGVFSLILGDNEADEAKLMEMQMSGGMAGGPGQPAQDMGKVFQAHGENLEMVRHKWIIPDAEQRLLRRKPSIVVG
jgi:hypothetical protein